MSLGMRALHRRVIRAVRQQLGAFKLTVSNRPGPLKTQPKRTLQSSLDSIKFNLNRTSPKWLWTVSARETLIE